jgi:coenzyme PQQ synthesis protein D (PqqD)
MQQSRRFSVDVRRVVHETIDGETILINLVSGNYYSLDGCGVEVWSLLSQGHSGDEVVGELQTRYPAAGDEVAEPVHALIDQLLEEGLIEPAGENGHANGNGNWNGNGAASGAAFVAPVLKKFTDLQYFLLLDPIHEVEAAGWPHERRDAAESDGAA